MASQPLDKYNLAYIFLLLHGIGFLLPWNAFINAREYYVDFKLNTTLSRNADYRINLMSYFGFAAHFPSLCFAAWNTFYQSKSSNSDSVCRFVSAMVLEIAVLLFTITLAIINTSEFPGVFFALTIVSLVLINSCVGIHQTLTFGIAAKLPMKYSNAVILGANTCGTIISVANIVTKSFAIVHGRSDAAIVYSAVAYFVFAITIIISCLISFFWLRRLKFVTYYTNLTKENHVNQSEENGDAKLPLKDNSNKMDISTTITNGNDDMPNSKEGLVKDTDLQNDSDSFKMKENGHLSTNSPDESSGYEVFQNCFGLCCFKPPHGKAVCAEYWQRYIITFKECWQHCLSIWSVFFCSLSIFPAIQSCVRRVDPNYFIPDTWFVDVTCFLCFNFFAMIGCIAPSWVKFPGPRNLWIVVWVRTLLFIPFFLFCNFDLPNPKLPVLITNDHIYLLVAILFAFSNGYLASLGMMYAPRNSPPERAGLAGMLAAFSLNLGVLSGIYASRGLANLIF